VDLDLVRIECEFISDSSAQLTAALFDALRNFESEFKIFCCPILQESCISCCESITCPYRIVFEQQLSSDPEIVRLHQKPSLPFSLYINVNDENRTSSYTVGMVVIGSAVNHIGCFHTALIRMIVACLHTILPPDKYSLHSYSLDYHGARYEITPASINESVILLSGQHILKNTPHSESVILSLKSPLRLLSNGSIAHKFDFASFFRSQLRRCSSLCAYYGTGELDLDFALLSESVQRVAVFDEKIVYTQPDWSTHPKRAGLIGTVECAGLVEPMHSLLLLGSYFNAGKGATFGSGFYQLEVL
jgi:hypothetical protein